MRHRVLLVLLFCLWGGSAFAQTIPNLPQANTAQGTDLTIVYQQALNSGGLHTGHMSLSSMLPGICPASGCDAVGPITIGVSGSQNALTITPGASPSAAATIGASGTGGITEAGWSVALGVSDASPTTPASGGTGYAAGDEITLNDGCSTHAQLTVQAVSSGAVTVYDIVNKGSCASAPANPVSVLSTSGSGTGATFNLTWAPLVSGLQYIPNGNNGNFLLTNNVNPGFAGTEGTWLGANAGSKIVGSNSDFDVILGVSACGGAGATTFTLSSGTCLGTDTARDLAGNSAALTVAGTGALSTQTYGVSFVAVYGNGAAYYENVNRTPTRLAIFGSQTCEGVSGSAAFYDAYCFGDDRTGSALTSANNFTLLGGDVAPTTFASGSDVLLVGTGAYAVDTPAANTSDYMSIVNVLRATGINTPSTSISYFAGDLTVGPGTALATSATAGFFHLPFTTAAPTGTPGSILGNACEVNTATETLNCYIGSGWYHVALTSGAG